MPGPVSDPMPGPSICACEHFKHVHDPESGACQADDCECDQYQEIEFSQSKLGQSIDDAIDEILAQKAE